ncbi:MAG: MerR family transcriptional regulator [Acidimicrobiia bacterium]|nr:MerR family transcriptional regulator [Acidimicrobiia bacterium]MCY4456740.1 MerR family transcriptional regulator [Acidimicrobiaceae bacterium]
MGTQPHHSIGEVLSLLQAEHSDVTISKIRFLESQGLIAPERTPSGYRKFYASDIVRLRWILGQQRDHYLPLKEIKKRLDEPGFAVEDELPDGLLPDLELETEPALEYEPERELEPAPETATNPLAQVAVEVEAKIEPLKPQGSESAEGVSALALAERCGIDISVVRELDRLGLIESVEGTAGTGYDSEALVVARAAAVFAQHGLEPRHMRMFKVSAQRQAGVFEQIFSARLAKGGETARVARRELNELVGLGEALQRLVLARSFGESLDLQE